MARSLNHYNMLPHDAFYQAFRLHRTLVNLDLTLLPILVTPIFMTHQEGARTSPFSYTIPRPSHQKSEGPNTGLVGCPGFQRQLWGNQLLPLVLSQCGQCALRQLGPRFRLPGRRASEGLSLWNLLRGGWIYWGYSKRVCVYVCLCVLEGGVERSS